MNSIEIAKSLIEDPEYPASVAKLAADFLEAVECLKWYSAEDEDNHVAHKFLEKLK